MHRTYRHPSKIAAERFVGTLNGQLATHHSDGLFMLPFNPLDWLPSCHLSLGTGRD
jgi:hypothetical protein